VSGGAWDMCCAIWPTPSPHCRAEQLFGAAVNQYLTVVSRVAKPTLPSCPAPPARLPARPHHPSCYAVALEFRRNTSGRVGRADFAWTVEHVLGIKLRPEMVGGG
jgi:hypothetical protein